MTRPAKAERAWALGGALALAALAAVYLVEPRQGPRDVAYAVVTLPLLAASAALCWRRAATGLPEERIAWRLLAGGGASWALADIAWMWVAVVQGRLLPSPHWTDALYLLNTPLVVAGVLALAWRSGTRHGLPQALDAILVAGGLFIAAWVAGLSRLVGDDAPGAAGLAVTLAYPVGDVIIVAALVLALSRLDAARRRQLAPLLGGLAAIAVADAGYALDVLQAGAYGPTLFDLGWGLGALGIGLAALRPPVPALVRQGPASRFEEFASSLMLLPALAILSVQAARGTTLDRVTVVAGLVTGAALLVRQAVFLDSHVRLSRRLTEASLLAGLGTWRTDRQGRVGLDDGARHLLRHRDATGPNGLAALADTLAPPGEAPRLLHDIEHLAVAATLERTVRPAGDAEGTSLQLRVTRHPDGTLNGTLLDITTQVRLEQERQRAAAKALEAERLAELAKAKTRFINTAAHELNTPLTPIRLSLASLKQKASHQPGPQPGQFDLLERNVERLTRLLHDVLEGARLQADHLRLTRRPMDLARLAREAVEEHQPHAQDKGVTLAVEAPVALPVHGDAARLHEVVMNLLSNAIKFTPAGGRIDVRAGPIGDLAVLEVVDTGRGIDPKDLPLLFQPFTQVGELLPAVGTGLGLYIARGIVEQHGGRLEASSPGLGQGATFRLMLPVGGGPSSTLLVAQGVPASPAA